MSHCSFCWLTFTALVWACVAQAAEQPRKPTKVLQPAMLEVAPARPNGNPWDTGIGAFARPDPQVTLLRHDMEALKEATELLGLAMDRRVKDLGKPVPPPLKELLEKNALQALRCGRTIEAMQDEPLTKARAKFAADTSVASDSVLSKLTEGGLSIALGDRVTIYVNDVDLAAHDVMGQHDLTITKELLEKGELELKFDSVELLRLKLVPAP